MLKSPSGVFWPVLFCVKSITGTLELSPRTENDRIVVKDHGNTVLVDPSRMRSRRKHRSKGTERILT
ncbi:MAG: hypothetical protein ACC656_09360 [Candidatus Heimdallarchaeota archaeon]